MASTISNCRTLSDLFPGGSSSSLNKAVQTSMTCPQSKPSPNQSYSIVKITSVAIVCEVFAVFLNFLCSANLCP